MNTQARAQILGSAMALLAFLNPESVLAQGLENPETIDAIVGTPVEEEEERADADPQKVIDAIEKTAENAVTVRRTTSLSKVDIVFLPDAAAAEGGPPAAIEAKLQEKSADVTQLRQEIEGNAMLFHAIDSRQVLMRDVLAVDFDDQGGVIIYAAAKPAG